MNRFLFKYLRYLGFVKLFRFIMQKDKVTIILFHDIDANTAEQTFKYLSSNYNIIELDTYIEAYYKKDFTGIPKYALIVTFDDGHIGNYNLLPIVQKYKIPMTIFLCASIIDTNRHFWFTYTGTRTSKERLKEISNKERLKLLAEDAFFVKKEFLTN